MGIFEYYKKYCSFVTLQTTHFDVEDVMIDIFYHFDKSTKRKAELADYCTFCDVEFRRVLKHVSTRWLRVWSWQSLGPYSNTLAALRSYFLSDGKQ